MPDDAQKLYEFLEIGDVVQYPNASGPLMGLGDGYGDWNVPWPQWQTGGLVPRLLIERDPLSRAQPARPAMRLHEVRARNWWYR